ncbi:MAG: metal ABC transporter permease [Verrucomicrobiota bacterium]|nr:metal ABC transporter permease [Verrucomicrobiota bacterium]
MFLDPFFLTALLGGGLAAIASGLVGPFVVVKRIAFLAGSISHSLLGGMGVCLFLQRTYDISWLHPLIGAFLGSIASALLIGYVHLHYRQREDAVIGAIWATGMAIGIIALSLTPGTNVELWNYLFGNILWINRSQLLFLLLLDVGLIAVFLFYYHRLLSLCFDEEQALLRGIPARALYLLLLTLISITIVLLMQVIGTVLFLALLTIPATLASLFTHRFSMLILFSIALSAFFNTAGLTLSYVLNWPPGSTIALFSACTYFALLPYRRRLTRSL